MKGKWIPGAMFAPLLLGWLLFWAPAQAQSPQAGNGVDASKAAAIALAPPELFYGDATIESAVLSPSGRWLALVTAMGGVRPGLIVFDLQTWKVHAQAARFVDADINRVHWVNDERLVFDVTDRNRGSGDQRWWPGLFSVSRDGSDRRQLVQLNRVFLSNEYRITREPLPPNHTLLHVGWGQANEEVVVGEWRQGSLGASVSLVPKKLNVLTGRSSPMALGAPAQVYRWIFDTQNRPRVAVSRKDGRETVYWSDTGEPPWRVLAESDAYAVPFEPAFIDAQGALYVTAVRGSGESVLTRFDFKTGKPEAEPLVSTPGFDFQGQLVGETPGAPALGVRVLTDAETTVWFDKRLAALQVQADQRLPGRVNRITCRRCAEADMTAVVHSWSDRDPGQFWIYTAANQAWRKVGDVRQGVDPQRMARTDFERIRARDGLEIPVWLTLPPGPKTPRAAVVLVHGGPWVRGRTWNWRPDAQFLASRGYVVIEPEFRGSTGYGGKLYRAGWRQWGQAMQDDLADALAWAVQKGQVDPKRVCIAGASYGGYATLMGLIRHPDLYRCGVAWVAVTDPRLMFEWRYGTDQSDDIREYDYPTLIGDPIKDAAMLQAVSPLAQVARLKAPLMLAIGGSDRRVMPVHGKRLRDALQDLGRPPTWVEYPEEGHGWTKLENKLDFARRLEAFLAEHLH